MTQPRDALPAFLIQRIGVAGGSTASASVAPLPSTLQIYAGAAALLALIGTFGVVSCTVSRLTRETAVRIAIGARPAAVRLIIVRQAMAFVLLGSAWA